MSLEMLAVKSVSSSAASSDFQGGLALIPGTNIDALVQKVEAKLGTCAFTIHAWRCKFAA